MKDIDQKQLGSILVEIGNSMIEDANTEYAARIGWGYVRSNDGDWLVIDARLRAGGAGFSNPIKCSEIAGKIERI